MEKRKETNVHEWKLNQFLSSIIEWAYDQPGIVSIGLVGSYANGSTNNDSDIDLILLCNKFE